MKIEVRDSSNNLTPVEFTSPIYLGASRTFTGHAKTSDYTLSEADLYIGVDASGGDVTITVPDSATLSTSIHWFVKRMDGSSNQVVIKLETPSNSMYGSSFSSMKLLRMGAGVEILLNANGTYVFSDWFGIQNPSAHPSITTQTPSLSDTTLTMNGTLESMGSFTSVDVYFRYRDITDNEAWIETSKVTKTTSGNYSDTATVTAGHVYAVQAAVDDGVDVHYGAVLQTSANYYADTTEASIDGLERYWALQESTGTDTAGAETMASDTLSFYNGVTIGSDTINGQTIYKRIFGTSDYGEAGYQPDWTYTGGSKTILIQVKALSSSGDHTILNFGRNVLSLASDGSSIQLEVNGSVENWNSATPFDSVMNLFITVDRDSWQTKLYTCTSTTLTERTSTWDIPDDKGVFMRVGRGASGDSNHQDFEYMDNGEVRSIAVWNRVLTESEMKDICSVLDNDGSLIVS